MKRLGCWRRKIVKRSMMSSHPTAILTSLKTFCLYHSLFRKKKTPSQQSFFIISNQSIMAVSLQWKSIGVEPVPSLLVDPRLHHSQCFFVDCWCTIFHCLTASFCCLVRAIKGTFGKQIQRIPLISWNQDILREDFPGEFQVW